MPDLLIGCGNSRHKRIKHGDVPQEFRPDLITLDVDPGTGCDVVHDLTVTPYPFADNQFDEVHAYEVLEHCGQQGDWRMFFQQFSEFWRILKPDGLMCITVPMWDSPWAFGDPGHTRVMPKEMFYFLSQKLYEEVGKTATTDYRPWWRGDFELRAMNEGEHQLGVVLKALKG